MQIPGRSYVRGETSISELRALTAGFEYADALIDDDLCGEGYDAVLVEGDLHLPRLELGEGVALLVVTGNLTVDGACVTTDDPATGLYVLGNFSAGSVLTAGMLGVGGDLKVARTLAGYYNDFSAIVKGTTRAAVFYPENHSFDFVGAPHFDQVLGKAAGYRVPSAWSGQVQETLRGRALLARATSAPVEGIDEVSAEELETYGATDLLEVDALYAHVRADKPLLLD